MVNIVPKVYCMKLVNVKHFFFDSGYSVICIKDTDTIDSSCILFCQAFATSCHFCENYCLCLWQKLRFGHWRKYLVLRPQVSYSLLQMPGKRECSLQVFLKTQDRAWTWLWKVNLDFFSPKPTPRDSTNCVSAIIWHVTCIKTRAKNKLCLFIFLFPALFKLFFVLSFWII